MTDKEKELNALAEEFRRRDDLINKKYPSDISTINSWLYTESIHNKETKKLDQWFMKELARINEKYDK